MMQDAFKKGHCNTSSICSVIFFLAFLKGNYSLTSVTLHWEKGTTQTFQRYLDFGSELTLIPRNGVDSQCGSLVGMKTKRVQVMNIVVKKSRSWRPSGFLNLFDGHFSGF